MSDENKFDIIIVGGGIVELFIPVFNINRVPIR